MTIETILGAIHPLPPEAMALAMHKVEELNYPRGHILINADRVERGVFFLKKGIARAFTNFESNEVTFWFGAEGDPVISMRSYVFKEAGYETVELLEDSVLYKIDSEDLKSLYDKNIYWANWGRRFAEMELIKTEQRLISRQFFSASERYERLLREYPMLIRRVQLGYIASFLGISRVSLSRIRATYRS